MHTYTRSYLIFHSNISYINSSAFILKSDSSAFFLKSDYCQGSTLEHEVLRNRGINCQVI